MRISILLKRRKHIYKYNLYWKYLKYNMVWGKKEKINHDSEPGWKLCVHYVWESTVSTDVNAHCMILCIGLQENTTVQLVFKIYFVHVCMMSVMCELNVWLWEHVHGGWRVGYCLVEWAAGWLHRRSKWLRVIADTARFWISATVCCRVAEIQTFVHYWRNPKAQQVAAIYPPKPPQSFTR